MQIIFNEPICIQSIILDSKVNTQCSNGFIISSSVDKLTFVQIAKLENFKNKNVHLYEFNRRQSDPDFNKNTGLEMNRAYFSTRSTSYLDRAIGIEIKLTKTLNSSSPCLKSIEVFGVLAKAESSINLELSLNKASAEIIKTQVEIPSEFIDEITHEMMRMPIRLPSSKTIDKKTLDTYLEERRRNNDAEKDPFTCIAFSKSYKPVIDEILKSKIDQFLFQNQSSILVNKTSPVKTTSESNKRKHVPNYSLEASKRAKFEHNTSATNSNSAQKCNCCLNPKSSSKHLYKLSVCEHVYCRHCLKSMNKTCNICNIAFENNQIINLDRAHL